MAGPSFGATPAPSLRLAVAPPASLDPRDLDTPDSLLVASQLFDGLVSYDAQTFDAVPAVAESWEVLEKGQAFVFHLRQGVTFHDGTPVTAGAFVTAWNRLADPVAAKPYAFLLESVEGFQKYQEDLRITALEGVRAPDDRTLEVRLVRPWADFVSLLGHPALSPVPTATPEAGFGAQPLGNGPYRMVGTLAPGSPISLERYDGYYGVPPAVPTVEFRTFDAPEDAWPAFLARDLELAEIPPPLLAEAQSRFGGRGIQTLARLLYCGLNEADERLAEPRLRRAISLAIERDEIAERVYGGLPVSATGLVPPSIPGHADDACGDICRHDPEAAAALVKEVPKKARTIALDFAASPTGERLASEIRTQLAAVGLEITPRAHDEAALEELLEAGGQQMFCLVWVADYPRQQAMLEPLLASGSPDNHARVTDPDIDALLETARQRSDPTVARAEYLEAERLALTAMHVIPLAWFRSHLALHSYVEGFSLDPLGRYDAASLSFGSAPPSPTAPTP